MNIRKVVPINWDLAANPMNWVIVALMILLAGALLAFVFHPSRNAASNVSEG